MSAADEAGQGRGMRVANTGGMVLGILGTGLPQVLLTPDANPGWRALNDAYGAARRKLEESGAELLLVYSTMWPSVIGHQIQARPAPEWVHVDELFHDLGSIPYRFRMDPAFAHALRDAAEARGLAARCVDYHGFPIDTGSVVALKLLNPDNRIPACVLSSNVYSDRAETAVFAKAARDAAAATGKKVAAMVVTSLSNRLFTDFVAPGDDRIHSLKDDEWNRKLLEFLADGRLEDCAQLSREIHKQVRVKKVVNFKPFWWLAGAMGQHNRYEGEVHGYAPVVGTGGAVVTLVPSAGGVGDKEFDEDDVEVFRGDRDVLGGTASRGAGPGAVGAGRPGEVGSPADPTPDGPAGVEVAPRRGADRGAAAPVVTGASTAAGAPAAAPSAPPPEDPGPPPEADAGSPGPPVGGAAPWRPAAERVSAPDATPRAPARPGAVPPLSDVAPGRPGAAAYPTSPLGEAEEGIPTGRDVEWEPLVDYRRHGVSETTIHGAVAWASGDEVVHSFGGNVLCYGRSMMKPVLMKVFAADLDPVLSPRQKAIAVSSHNGDTEHVAAAQSILDPAEWPLMQTPLDVPLVQFGRQVRRARRWYHCCSGEHAAILRGLRLRGQSRVGYTLPHHPLQDAFLGVLRRYLGAGWEPKRVARDGCGLPTVSNTVAELARIFAGLARERHDDWIWGAMTRFPDLVGGFNRLDSTVIKAGGGEVIAKEGADGLLGMAITHPDYPAGLGVVVKIAHGWNAQATWYVARAVLGSLGISLRNPYPLHRQKAFVVPGIVPPARRDALEGIPTWDEWDPDTDRWYYDFARYGAGGEAGPNPG